MNNAERSLILLTEFAGQYLHQDADLEHGDFGGILTVYLRESGLDGKSRELFLIALLRLLSKPQNDIVQTLSGWGASFIPDNLSEQGWLSVLDIFQDN